MAAFLVPIVKALIANGLGTLASAVAAKGKEYIEDKIGVEIPDTADGLTGDKLLELKKAEMAHEEFLVDAGLREKEMELKAEAGGQQQVTERWRFDMTSDSWLSKNIRPLTLAYWTVAITLLIVMDSFLAHFEVKPAWIELIETSYTIVLAAYFVGRTFQHVQQIRSKNGART